MGKRHISIIGSCVSRQMFNALPLLETFDVDCYAYQIAPWDLFSQGLGIDKDDIYAYYQEQFTARMLWYDLNKVTVKEIESRNSEYLMIDLYTAFAAKIERFSFDEKLVYSQCSYDRSGPFLKFVNGKRKYDGFGIKTVTKEEIGDDYIKSGYDKLISWAKSHFDSRKIIINVPSFSNMYYNLESTLLPYSDEDISKRRALLMAIKRQSLYLHERIPGSVLFDLSEDDTTAQFGLYEDATAPQPAYMHYTDEDYCRHSLKLLALLGIDFDSEGSRLSALGTSSMEFKNLYLKEKFTKKPMPMLQVSSLNINEYFKRIENISDVIIVITAKDEASNRINGFTEKDELGIKADLRWRYSYIAIVDKCRSFVYEQAGSGKLSYDYIVEGINTVHVESAGFNSGNISSVKIGDSTLNCSYNQRGLNVVLLNSKTLDIVDSAYCDSFADVDLKMHSDYFSNVKIKI